MKRKLKLKTYLVSFTYDINGEIEVEATTEKQAKKKVYTMLGDWGFDGIGDLRAYDEQDRSYQTTDVNEVEP